MKGSLFLSYARKDDEAFVSRLHRDLIEAGFDVWFDRVSMPSRQLTFLQEIRDAIAARDRLILVVGPKAAASDYVRQEWRSALEMGKGVNPIVRLDDYVSGSGKVDGYELIPEELKLLHAEDFRDESKYTGHLNNLIRQLLEPLPPIGKLIAVPALPPHYQAQPDRLRKLREALLIDLHKPVVVTGASARIGVQGMGGIGKSVLASAVVRDPEVRRAFPDGIFWISIGQQPNLLELQREIAKALGYEADFKDIHAGKQKLRDLLQERAALLILDDVWRSSDADTFDVIGPRCKLLLTTRDAGLVSSLAGVDYEVELPGDAEAFAILASAARVPVASLPSLAGDIVEECGRLPLALALCGGMASRGHSWDHILDALRNERLELITDRHELEDHHQNIWRAMEVSMRFLSADEQRRFAELAVFGEDINIPEAAVLTLWSHTGGLDELAAADLLVNFKERSLLRLEQSTESVGDASRHISLHDLLHDFATRTAKRLFGSLASLHNELVEAYRKQCPYDWADGPNDGYYFQHLVSHMEQAGRDTDLIDLMDGAFPDTKLVRTGSIIGIAGDYEIALDACQRRRNLVHGIRLCLHRSLLSKNARLLTVKGTPETLSEIAARTGNLDILQKAEVIAGELLTDRSVRASIYFGLAFMLKPCQDRDRLMMKGEQIVAALAPGEADTYVYARALLSGSDTAIEKVQAILQHSTDLETNKRIGSLLSVVMWQQNRFSEALDVLKSTTPDKLLMDAAALIWGEYRNDQSVLSLVSGEVSLHDLVRIAHRDRELARNLFPKIVAKQKTGIALGLWAAWHAIQEAPPKPHILHRGLWLSKYPLQSDEYQAFGLLFSRAADIFPWKRIHKLEVLGGAKGEVPDETSSEILRQIRESDYKKNPLEVARLASNAGSPEAAMSALHHWESSESTESHWWKKVVNEKWNVFLVSAWGASLMIPSLPFIGGLAIRFCLPLIVDFPLFLNEPVLLAFSILCIISFGLIFASIGIPAFLEWSFGVLAQSRPSSFERLVQWSLNLKGWLQKALIRNLIPHIHYLPKGIVKSSVLDRALEMIRNEWDINVVCNLVETALAPEPPDVFWQAVDTAVNRIDVRGKDASWEQKQSLDYPWARVAGTVMAVSFQKGVHLFEQRRKIQGDSYWNKNADDLLTIAMKGASRINTTLDTVFSFLKWSATEKPDHLVKPLLAVVESKGMDQLFDKKELEQAENMLGSVKRIRLAGYIAGPVVAYAIVFLALHLLYTYFSFDIRAFVAQLSGEDRLFSVHSYPLLEQAIIYSFLAGTLFTYLPIIIITIIALIGLVCFVLPALGLDWIIRRCVLQTLRHMVGRDVTGGAT